jgi:hypothetical protein
MMIDLLIKIGCSRIAIPLRFICTDYLQRSENEIENYELYI